MSRNRFTVLEELAGRISLRELSVLARARREQALTRQEMENLNAEERREIEDAPADALSLSALGAYRAGVAGRRIPINARLAALAEREREAVSRAAKASGRERAVGFLRAKEEKKARARREKREEETLATLISLKGGARRSG